MIHNKINSGMGGGVIYSATRGGGGQDNGR